MSLSFRASYLSFADAGKRQIGHHNALSAMEPRQSTPTPKSDGSVNMTALLGGIGAIGGLTLLFFVYWLLSRGRQRTIDFKAGQSKQSNSKWTFWRRRPSGYRTAEHLEPISESSSMSNRRSSRGQSTPTSTTNVGSAAHEEEPAAAGVDRNTSVRSVMTLPAYRPAPGDSERVLGREGERGGIDVVLEYPETVGEIEEQRREDEMEALYQVRLARRTEAAEREELRRLRREARERGDVVALGELRARSRAASGQRAASTLDELREEHRRLRDRPRAVSSVSYADLGVASHDGTRLRANSEESERPLLGDAASMSSSHLHRRDRSASSVLSIDSDLPSPGLSRSRADSRAESSLRRDNRTAGGNMSSPELIDAEQDLGDHGFPIHSPPEYEDIALGDAMNRATLAEDPPEYHSPVTTRAPEFSLSGPGESPLLSDGQGNRNRAGGRQNRASSYSNGGLGIRAPNSSSPTIAEGRGSERGGGNGRGRGVGGTPQLPSLRLGTLPSIVVEGATPIGGD